MLDSVLIEITRRPMSYRTVIALTEPNETAFPASSWLLMFLLVLSIAFHHDSPTLTVEFTYPKSSC
jgi:hypothetical protein